MRRGCLLLLLAACMGESPEQEARDACRKHYDILNRWVTGRGRLPEGDGEAAEAAGLEGPDPWGNPYFVEFEGGMRVWSNGPDGEPDTGDDICFPSVKD